MTIDVDRTLAKELLKGYCTAHSIARIAEEAFLARLIQLSREGHLCARLSDFDDPTVVDRFPAGFIEEGRELFPKAPLIRHQDRLYLQKNWVYESYIIQQVERLKSLSSRPLCDEAEFEKRLLASHLHPLQQKAIREALHSSFTLFYGGPGTGKTHTAMAFVQLLAASLKQGEKLRVYLAAPTGKAAAHLHTSLLAQGKLGSAVRIEATTLHRLLKLQPKENRLFSGRRIDADLIVVDEASMIDTPLLAHLLEGVGERLLLMGDPDQLPPVETGSLFAELAPLFGVRLEKSMRTEQSALQQLAFAIQRGDAEGTFRLITPMHLSHAFDETLVRRLFDQISPIISWERPDPQKCLEAYGRVRILDALRQGPYGTTTLNQAMLHLLELKLQVGQWWAVPILATANDSRTQLYNGASGVLIGQKQRKELCLKKGISYFSETPQSSPPPFELAFCLSIHKSQGSEYEKVIALFPAGSENFGRESLYTAATRAKESFQWIGEEEVLRKMVAQQFRRRSGLSARLRQERSR